MEAADKTAIPEQSPDPPTPPGVEEERRGEPVWYRWKGSVAEVVRIFRLADELVDRADAQEEGDPAYAPARFTIGLKGKDRSLRELEDLESELEAIDLDSVQTIRTSTRFSEQLNIMLSFDRQAGVWWMVSGKDQFAVTGSERELTEAVAKGRRWAQASGAWPGQVSFWSPWLAILGLTLIPLVGGDVGKVIGLGLVLLAFLSLGVILWMRLVVPKLVPPLELLKESEQRTVAQIWGSRALRVAGFASAAIAGAALNGLTGLFF